MASVRIRREGITLRFADADTPAPEDSVAPYPPPRILVALSPVDPRAKVSVVLRSDGRERALALRAGVCTRDEQFFEGGLLGLKSGNRVEYFVRVEFERQGGTVRFDSSGVPGGLRRIALTGGAPRLRDFAAEAAAASRAGASSEGQWLGGARVQPSWTGAPSAAPRYWIPPVPMPLTSASMQVFGAMMYLAAARADRWRRWFTAASDSAAVAARRSQTLWDGTLSGTGAQSASAGAPDGEIDFEALSQHLQSMPEQQRQQVLRMAKDGLEAMRAQAGLWRQPPASRAGGGPDR